MAATHKIEIFKSAFGETWGNVWLCDAGSLEAAQAIGARLYDAEVSIHLPVVTFTTMRVSTLAPNDDSYLSIPLNNPGESEANGEAMPLFVTERFDIVVAGGGRPSRKYYRGVLTELYTSATVIDPAHLGAIQGLLQDAIDDLTALGTPPVDPQGQPLTTVVGWPHPQMRQLHRRRRAAVIG